MREADLVEPLVRHFEEHGLRAVAEVPIAGRRADLVGVGEDILVAVELKLARWRQALRQAVAYQLWAHESYVALPFPRALAAVRHRHAFEAEGVGLFAVLDGGVRTFLRASASPRQFPALTDLVRRQLAPPVLPLTVFPDETASERFYGDALI